MPARLTIPVLAVLTLAHAAAADIIYDSITGTPHHSTVFSEDELADDTTLATGLGTMIRQVEIGIKRNIALPGPYSGTMTVRLWSDAGGTPGTLLGTSAVPISLTDNNVHIIPAAFPDIVAPTATIWTGIQFSYITQLGAGIAEGQLPPSVGSTSDLHARHFASGTWSVYTLPGFNSFIRISTVPSPSAAIVLALALAVPTRRRRVEPRRTGLTA